MKIQDVKLAVKYLFETQLTGFLWGHSGKGKTETMRQIAKEMNFKFFAFYLGQMSDVGDLLGLAHQPEINGKIVTEFALPGWMREMITYCEQNPDSGAIIFLDELNHARKDLHSVIFPLALDKKFHTTQFPVNCHFIAAGNPDTDDYCVTDMSSRALKARFVHIDFDPSVEEWVEFAKLSGMDADLIGFINSQPRLLEDQVKEFTLPVAVDRRRYTQLDRLIKAKTPPNILKQLMYGIVGMERTVAFEQYLKQIDKPLTADEILSGSKIDLIKKWSRPDHIESSYLNLSCDSLKDKMDELHKTGSALTVDQKDHLIKFFELIPKDIAYAAIDKLGKIAISSIKEVPEGTTITYTGFRDFMRDPLVMPRLIRLWKTLKIDKKDN